MSPEDWACINAFRMVIQFDKGTEQEAFDICVQSAKAGARGAQNLIAEGYLGSGNKEKALYWFKQAAEQGHEGAKLRVVELMR